MTWSDIYNYWTIKLVPDHDFWCIYQNILRLHQKYFTPRSSKNISIPWPGEELLSSVLELCGMTALRSLFCLLRKIFFRTSRKIFQTVKIVQASTWSSPAGCWLCWPPERAGASGSPAAGTGWCSPCPAGPGWPSPAPCSGSLQMSNIKEQGQKTFSCEWVVFKWSLRSFVDWPP